MRVTLATHDSPWGRFLAHGLHAAGAVDRIVIERRRASAAFRLRKLRRVGPVDALFQLWLARWFTVEGARHLPRHPLPPHAVVDDLNAWSFAPDELVVGFGTSILRADTLARAPHGVLNLHTGWLPAYRGVKAEFWTLLHDDRERAGWTLHYMTPRLDAGAIVAQGRATWGFDSPAALRAALLVTAVAPIAALLTTARRTGRAPAGTPPVDAGRYFTTPTWRDWRAWRRRAAA